MKTRTFFAILSIVLGGLLALPAMAQDKVKIKPGGVEVESGNVRVKANGNGVEVDTPDSHVKAKAGGVDLDAASRGAHVDTATDETGAAASGPAPKGLKRHAPIVCQGNRNRSFSHIFITGNKDGVLIQGNCDVTLKDSRIEVGRHGIDVQGNGSVRLVRTYVKGKKSAVMIMGNGDVTASGCTLIGGVSKLGNGDFIKKGKNVIRDR